MSPEPFTVRVPEDALIDLQHRLARTRWPDSIRNSGWEYGTDNDTLRRLVVYWQEKFDWRKEEAHLNSFAQFTTKIQNLRVHYVHLRNKNRDAMPVILTHGWPGTFLELLKVGQILHEKFHVVIPSLPGYAFSEASKEPGMNPKKIASMWLELMHGLGYSRFVAQGGDWGATVSTWLALDAPESVYGIHLNYIPGSYQPHIREQEILTANEKEFLRSKEEWLESSGAYGHIQGTKPQTLAFAIHDSPVGLAAWILEKAHGWSYCETDVLKHFSEDELLANITLYWLTESFHSSIRLYYEGKKSPLKFQSGWRVNVPTSVVRFAKEEPMPPREWVERGYNVCRWTEYPLGSHFAPMEVPELLAQDIIESINQIVP